MKIHRLHFLTHVAAACLLAFSVLLLVRGVTQAVPLITGELPTGAAFSGNAIASPGDTNVKVAEFNIEVSSQSIVTNGATYTIAEGNPLTLIESDTTLRYLDDTQSDGQNYEDGFIIFDTVDNLIDAADTVVFGGPFSEFPASPEANGLFGVDGWLDQNSNGLFDTGEDFIGLGSYAGAAADGSTIRLFADNELVATNGTILLSQVYPFLDSTSYAPVNPAFITDTDNDNVLSAGDIVAVAGSGNINPLSASDSVCFDGSISDDAEFDYTDSATYENIWWDAAGDCSAFTTGADIVLAGSGVPSGTSTEFGVEGEVGYLDVANLGVYTCSRGQECYEIVYSGVNGTDWSDGGDFTTSTVFFDPSLVATDGLVAAANEWGSGGYDHLNTLVDLSYAGGGEVPYAYIDANADAGYDHGEAILIRETQEPGTSTSMATGQTFLRFANHNYHYLNTSPNFGLIEDFLPDREVLFISADATLDAGAIDGSGIDDLAHRPVMGGDTYLTLFSADNRSLTYYDHDSSGSLQTGDDIVNGIGFYAADDLLSFRVTDNGSDYFDDSTLDGLYLYRSVGASCAGAGTDTLIASDTSAPMLGADMSVTADLFNVSDNSTPDNTLCLYADIDAAAYLGTPLAVGVLNGTVTFSSGNISSDINLDTGDEVVIAELVDISVGATPGTVSSANAISYSITSPGDIPQLGNVYMGFPSTVSVTGATGTCTVGGSTVAGSSMAGAYGPRNLVVFTPSVSQAITNGQQIVCTASNVTGPDTAGVYSGGVFLLQTSDGTFHENALEDVAVSYTFLEAETETGGGCDDCSLPIIEPPTYDVTVVTPNGGETVKAGSLYPISWTADEEVAYVNLAYSIDGGKTYKDIVRGVPSSGSLAWNVPKVESTQVLVRIQATDLATVRNEDSSDAVFTIIDPNKPYITWRSPEGGASLQAGTKQWLLWDSSKVITDIELSLSTDGGLTYPITTGKVKNANAYQIQLPSTDVAAAYIKIVGYAKGYSPVTVTVGPISILADVDDSALTITAPNSMQAFVAGQTTTITWETTGDVPLVEIQFAPDGKTWTPISEFIENTGSFDWTIPDTESQYAFVRVGGTSKYGRYVFDRSDEPFWIVRTIVPAVTLTSPKAQTQFSVGEVMDIIWDTVGSVPSTNLYIVFADGAKTALALSMQNVGLFKATIPEMPIDTFGILLEGLDEKGKVIADDKSGPFSIGRPSTGTDTASPTVPATPIVNPILPCIIWGSCGSDSDDVTVLETGTDNGGVPEGTFFTPPGTGGDVPGGGSDGVVEIAIFDQSGLDLYEQEIVPRVTVANGTIELNLRKRMDAIIGSSLLLELITTEGNFVYATNDGRSEPLEVSDTGVRFAYVPVGAGTTDVKIQSQGMEPPYSLSLRIDPQPKGYVEGLANQDGSEEVVLLKGSTEWDSVATGQPNPMHIGTDGLFAWYVPDGAYTVELHDNNGALVTKRLSVTNNIVNPALVLGEVSATQEVSLLVDLLLPDDVQDIVVAAAENVRANETAQAVAVVAVPAAAAAAVTSATVLGSSFSLLSYLQYLFTSPFLLFNRRKRRSYGTVYNSVTKVPVPFATIRFYDRDNRIARSVVTDTAGRYTVNLPPGTYRPVVIKPGYLFPSEQITSEIDGELENVYNTGFIHVTLESPFVLSHFPIDPDQIAGRVVSLRRVAIVRMLQYIVAYAGVLIALYGAFMNPNKVTLGLLAVQVVVLLVSIKLTKVHARVHVGKVIDAQGKPMAGTVVRLFESTYNKLVETQRTDAQGRYSFLAKDGSFYVVAETARGKVTSATVDYRGQTELKPVAPVLKI